MTISWWKQGKREFIDLSMSEKVGSHSLPNRTPTTDNKYVADNGRWKATGPGYSVSYNYLGERPNGSTNGIFVQIPKLLHYALPHCLVPEMYFYSFGVCFLFNSEELIWFFWLVSMPLDY
ncbi:hypothetical protein PROFUN_16429 [Planoprotostelium fungivorum]|uniref:Uncharacterized protein n=1 Tax=Planoprotostelium fungivorum TaxID=1890364 RepID=A0A2P6MN28_9EUKA|nr:hypothetical protein PROFUN_16429 [Planoprotostelium fungivorum]